MVISTTFIFSQTIEEPSTVRIIQEPVEEIITEDEDIDPFATLPIGAPMKMKILIQIESSLNLDNIHVKVGSTLNSNDIIEETFIFDEVFDDGTLSYERQDDQIFLGIGVHPYSNQYFCEVYFSDNDGNTSSTSYYPEQ